MFNWCVFTGIMCDELFLTHDSDGQPILAFHLAIQAWGHPVGRVKILCFSQLAGFATQYLRQGERLAVVGILLVDGWQGDDGEWRNDPQVIAVDIELLKEEIKKTWPI